MIKNLFIACITGLAVGISSLIAFPSAADSSGPIEINETNFPDEAFRTYILDKIDKNKNGVLDGIEPLSSVIDVMKKEISSLNGIEFFPELEYLYCDGNELKTIDVSKNTMLKLLRCTDNKLETLILGEQNSLKYIWCQNNELTELDVSTAPNITEIMCHNNKLTSLDVTKNTKLINLQTGNPAESGQNSFITVDLTKNTELKQLSIENCGLLSLDLSQNTALTALVCKNNKLTSIDVSACVSTIAIQAEGNTYDLGECSEFDLEELEQYGLDVSKMSSVRGAVLENKLLKDFAENSKITYMYDIGHGQKQEFSLIYTVVKEEETTAETQKPIDTTPEETDKPVDTAPEETDKPVDTTPEETDKPVDTAPEETDKPVDTTPEETDKPVDTAPEETDKPVDTTSVVTNKPIDTASETQKPTETTSETENAVETAAEESSEIQHTETIENGDSDENKPTGLILSFVPAIASAAAVTIAKKKG